MQNETTLNELGFEKSEGSKVFWSYKGSHQKFTAVIKEQGSRREYVTLFLVLDQIDQRPNSDRKGSHSQKVIKDCSSEGSVKAAIEKYDIPSDGIEITTFTISIKE